MHNKNEIIYNNNIKIKRIIFGILCLFLPLALFLVPYLLITKEPTDTIEGKVTNKSSQTIFSGKSSKTQYYITIESIKLNVSYKLYKMLSKGDSISAAYRKNILYYYTTIECTQF